MGFYRNLKNIKSNFVNYFLFNKIEEDEVILFNTKRLIEGLSVFLIIFAIVTIMGFLGFEKKFPTEIACLVCISLLFLIKKGVSIIYIGNILLATSFGMLIYQIIILETEIIAFFRWFIIVPLFSLLFINKKSTYFWSFIVVIICILLYSYDFKNSSILSNSSYKFYFFIDSFFFLILTVALIILYHNRKEKLSQKLLKEKKEMKRQSKKLSLYKDRLIEKNKELETYAYVASHDLKAPVRGIFSFTELLELNLTKNNLLDEKNSVYLNQIKENTLHMNNLIVDVLNYSEINSLNKSAFSKTAIAPLIGSIIKQFPSYKKQISFDDNTNLKITILPTAIKQVFQNLISNSIKFAKDEEELKINIEIKEKDNHILFHLKDNGIGIQEENLKLVFQPFKKLNNNKKYPGSGIGLATCEKIIQKHGGEIWVTSTEGKGTTFSFTIPKK